MWILSAVVSGLAAYAIGRIVGYGVGWRRAMRMIRDFNDAEPERGRIRRAEGNGHHYDVCKVCDDCEPSPRVNTEA